jgi:hypothetical protein
MNTEGPFLWPVCFFGKTSCTHKIKLVLSYDNVMNVHSHSPGIGTENAKRCDTTLPFFGLHTAVALRSDRLMH